MDQHLERRKEAKHILDQIDQVLSDLRRLLDDNVINNLNSLDSARFSAYRIPDGLSDEFEGMCHPETRIDLLREIMHWATSPGAKPIFWLNGMAGTGKSTISRTLANILDERGDLGASFFFKRGESDQSNAKRLFTTVARQVMEKIPQMIPFISKAAREGISDSGIDRQFKHLLQDPFDNMARENEKLHPLVVVIDALDECDYSQDIISVLEQLTKAAQHPEIPLRFFLTSRPDLPSQVGFDELESVDRQGVILQDIPQDMIKNDLSKVLSTRLAKIGSAQRLGENWPGESKIQELVEISVPLFIFAATICRFIGSSLNDPRDLLDSFLCDAATLSNDGMDKVYLPVLRQPFRHLPNSLKMKGMQGFHNIIGAIILLAAPLSPKALAHLTDTNTADVYRHLMSFRSVLSFSDNDDDVPIRVLHLSFRDFLMSADSPRDFHVEKEKVHGKLAARCLFVMRSLTKNICGLPNPGTERIDIEPEILQQKVSSQLQYACRYWLHHVGNCEDLTAFELDILAFLQQHLLHWLEAMSIIGFLRETVGVLDTLIALFEVSIGSSALYRENIC